MTMVLVKGILTFILLHLSICVRSQQYKELNTRLRDGLLEYNPYLRPVYNFNETLEISLYVYFHSLVEVKETENTILSVVFISAIWKDIIFQKEILESLCIREDCGSLYDQHFPLESKTIWTPDLRFFNSRTALNIRTEADVAMTFSGYGFLSRGGLFDTFCSIEAQKYPFDEQECFFEFGSGLTNPNHMTINTGNLDIILDYKEENGEWDLKSSTTYVYDEYALPRYRYVIRLKRRSTLILFSMVIPTTLISLTGTLCFILPTESGERLTLVISIALALILYLTIIQSYLPRSVTSISYFEMLMSGEMALCLFCVVMTIISIDIYYKPRKFIFYENSWWYYAFSRKARLVRDGKTKHTEQDERLDISVKHDEIEANYVLSRKSRNCTDVKSTSKEKYVISWKEVSRVLDKLCFSFSLTLNIAGFICFLVMALV